MNTELDAHLLGRRKTLLRIVLDDEHDYCQPGGERGIG